ncbi:MAG: glycosyltransferase, partial [Gammaproteobacteria bacterium]
AANQKTPKAIGIGLEYDEGLSHLLEAGADMFLMPSRFEPCGLNQMYSLRYGTPPIARKTGGLADSIVHSSPATVANHTANGFLFKSADATSLLASIDDALRLYRESDIWQNIIKTGMAVDNSWLHSARQYEDIYRRVVET